MQGGEWSSLALRIQSERKPSIGFRFCVVTAAAGFGGGTVAFLQKIGFT
jgi:hypothetical protein